MSFCLSLSWLLFISPAPLFFLSLSFSPSPPPLSLYINISLRTPVLSASFSISSLSLSLSLSPPLSLSLSLPSLSLSLSLSLYSPITFLKNEVPRSPAPQKCHPWSLNFRDLVWPFNLLPHIQLEWNENKTNLERNFWFKKPTPKKGMGAFSLYSFLWTARKMGAFVFPLNLCFSKRIIRTLRNSNGS